MANFNRITLVGNLTRDPELSYTPSNVPVCKFGLAVNDKWTTKEGVKKEETLFVDCVIWRKPAEIFNQYTSKGKPVLVEGKLRMNEWTNKEGQKQCRLEVTVRDFTFLGGRDDPENRKEPEPAREPVTTPPPDDDIPF